MPFQLYITPALGFTVVVITIEGVVQVNVCDGLIAIVGTVLFNITVTIFALILETHPFVVLVTTAL